MKLSHHLFRSALLSTISISSFGFCSSAMAQGGADAEYRSDDVIIVTASKREQTLQDTPISVSVTSAEAIERSQVRDILDLQTLVPSLRVGQLRSSANTNFIIRGFGNGAGNVGIEPSVGVFIDGVYRSRSAAQIGDLPNIQRVEVLRGPQSTLFGKNASAGIISIITQEPRFEFGGSIEASYGNYDAVVVKGDVTGPISEKIAFSLAGNYNRRDGYAHDVRLNDDVNNRNRYGIRGQLLFEASDSLKFRLIGDYDKIDEECCSVANVFNGPTGAIVNFLAGGTGIDAGAPYSYNVYSNFASENKIRNYGISLQGDYEVGNFSLTSITAYRKVDSYDNQDVDFTAADLIGLGSTGVKIDTFTQELRLASDFDGPINFLVGGFYFNEKVDQVAQLRWGSDFRAYGDALIQSATGGALSVDALESTFGDLEGDPGKYDRSFFRTGDGLNESYVLKNESYAIFGTVDFEIADGLILTGGLNYTKDRKRFSTNVISTDVFSAVDFDAAAYAPFREALLIGAGVDAATAAFLAANPTYNALANPLNGLKGLQFQPPFMNVPNVAEPGRTRDSKLTYTARLSYKASDNISLYATYATGFKASSINLSRDSRPTPADLVAIRTAGRATPNLGSGTRFAGPEEASVYEIGLKTQFPGFALNLALFKQELKGFQSNIFAGTGFVLDNAEKQSTKGLELDASISPSDNLTFTASYTYLDPLYDKFTGGSIFDPATNSIIAKDLSGLKPAWIPQHSIAVGGTYSMPLGNENALVFHTDYSFSSAYEPGEGLFYKANPESLNASIALELSNGLQISVWGRNLTAPKYNSTLFASVAQPGSLSGYPSPPAFYGASAKVRF